MTRDEWRAGVDKKCRDCGETFLARWPSAKRCIRCGDAHEKRKTERHYASLRGVGVGQIIEGSGMPPYLDADSRYEVVGVTLPAVKPPSDWKTIPFLSPPGHRRQR